MLLLYAVLAAATFWYFFIVKKPKNSPPGPWFRLPLLGQMHYSMMGGRIQAINKLRRQYGDIYMLDSFIPTIVVCDFDMMQEMLAQDIFSGRGNEEMFSSESATDFFRELKGGHGFHGLIGSEGDEWREQRRFVLRHLRDFGFGKSSMEDIIKQEFKDLAEKITQTGRAGKSDMDSHMLFNLVVMNVLWGMIAGERFDVNDAEQLKRLEEMETIFREFGPGNPALILQILAPRWLAGWARPYGQPMINRLF